MAEAAGQQEGRFSRTGLGTGLGRLFDTEIARRRPRLLDGQRGRQLLVTCDIGGSLKDQGFETFSFLVIDVDRNRQWLATQSAFRSQFFTSGRRMAFKSLNDGLRRHALAPFLRLASLVDGVLVTFAIDKMERPRLSQDDEVSAELHELWKPAVADRLLWVIYLAVFLVGGLSAPGQDIMFIIDEDEVAANVPQLTKLTELFERAYSAQGGPMMGHLRCGTAKSDDGSFALEDLVAIPDLSAGAVAELTAALRKHGAGPLSPLIQRLPKPLSWKTRTIMPWLEGDGPFLTRLTCVIDGVPGAPTWRATVPRWYAVDDPARLELPTAESSRTSWP